MREPVITRPGLERLFAELDRLRTEGRREVAERIRHVLATEASAVESSDYLDAREQQALLELRIARMEEWLSQVRVAEPDGDNDVLDVGERVLLRDLATGEAVEYELVGPLEADPAAGRVSCESPLGRAVVGRSAGAVAVVNAPRGRRRFEILAIVPAEADALPAAAPSGAGR
jgi:transcription elongation factor GreA